MDTLPALLKGLTIGFSIAAPVGPIGLLCIRRTLADGPAHGFVSGLGAASADAVYGAIAGFGVVLVTDALLGAQVALKLVGGLMLLWLGWSTLRARPAERAADARGGGGLAGAYASTFALTLANPATILSFAAVFGGLGVSAGDGSSTGVAALLVAGVFTGSAMWWLGLSASVGAFRRRVTPAAMLWINRASGAVLGVFGIAALASLL
ncbi:LysE family translocator [Azospirillum brasilense]|uniref:LysE family translocator n=1 Tax=Azospirillum brasilense TaxID=192 RepID=A0A0N7I7U8_AZOBR|nr:MULTISPECIES: LysE family transporter [Azospirillum]ALJ35491.1 lysine transporter LysE [Azospirillum brasilense]MDW7555651.1 LysE family transporter [Azospirillum brasilense]MDW7595578.1 LysE family transporter [Azospirillum brasilense]MDW7630583.1 LysE family transporter [Azospirillum brasilense]MDX5954221.1 LysE family transporter [Azospirillum brasilense]